MSRHPIRCDAALYEPTRYDVTLDEMLDDPIVQAVMRADAIDRRKIETLLSDVARKRGTPEKTPAAGLWGVLCRARPAPGRCLSR